MQTLSNEKLAVTVKPKGAELCGLRDANGVEYMWQADPEVWGRHAPVLFPIVGKLPKNQYRHDDRTYTLSQHGFARDKEFELVQQSADELIYRLVQDEETLACYPFAFTLDTEYKLAGNRLEITHRVSNPSDEKLLFSIGAHPGFSCAWSEGDALEDYYLEFEKNETLNRDQVVDGLLASSNEPFLENERMIPLTADLFDEDALVFHGAASDSLTLCCRNATQRLRVSFPGFPDLGIWAKPGAPFVCIEPWYGFAAPVWWDDVLRHKPGIISLEPRRTFNCTYAIVILRD